MGLPALTIGVTRWQVAPHEGERYSVIYYVSNGPVVPQGRAVLRGEEVKALETGVHIALEQ